MLRSLLLGRSTVGVEQEVVETRGPDQLSRCELRCRQPAQPAGRTSAGLRQAFGAEAYPFTALEMARDAGRDRAGDRHQAMGHPAPEPAPDAALPVGATAVVPLVEGGAATGLYLTLAFLALRIRNPALRRVVVGVCVAIPLLVATARLYRGMHRVSDILVAIVNGSVAALLSWCWLRRSDARSEAGDQTRA